MVRSSFIEARSIALYSAVRNEVGTTSLFKSARDMGKHIYYPSVTSRGLEFRRVNDLVQLRPGKYSIPEPDSSCELVDTREIDLFIVPGVGFDRTGARIGYGKGYYDTALSGVARERIFGLCFSLQVLDHIPVDKWDVRMGTIITEGGVLECS